MLSFKGPSTQLAIASGLVLPCAHMQHLRHPQLAMLADAPASKEASSPSAGQSEANSADVVVKAMKEELNDLILKAMREHTKAKSLF